MKTISMAYSGFVGVAFGAFFLMLPMFVSTTAQAQTGRKYALLIGIGNYPKEGGWQVINAVNDITLISATLQKRGFPAENIVQIKDQEATRAGILNAFRQHLLNRVQAGDMVYFQFSGHGQWITDDNGDELDGRDEAIVSYDSPKKYPPGSNEGQFLIRDDELNMMFTDLRRRLGPSGNLLVVIDACHSGTATRGLGPARGTDEGIVIASAAASLSQAPAADKAQFDAGADAGALAPMAAYFGSAQNQLNYETLDEQGRRIGPLSYAIGKKLGQASETTTYRGLFEQIRLEMATTATTQQPQAEGMLDQVVLGGQLLPKPAYFRVVRWDDPGTVAVGAGSVQGIHEGSVLGLYPPETRDPAKSTPLARGTVTSVQPFDAVLTLDKDLSQQTARTAWVYVLEQNFGDLEVGLSLQQLPENLPVRSAMLEKIARYPMVKPDAAPELYLVASGSEIQLVGPGNMLLKKTQRSTPAALAADTLLRSVLAFAQAKYLRRMDMESDNVRVEIELIPVTIDPKTKVETGRFALDSRRDANGVVHFKNKDWFKVRVTNKGDKAAYFTLIDIQPDNVLNVLIPYGNLTPTECRVGPGDSKEIPRFFPVSPPYGVEMFKLIATEKPIDLRVIAQTKGADTRANVSKSPLEKLFGQTFFNDECLTRAGKTESLSSGSIHVHSFSFIID